MNFALIYQLSQLNSWNVSGKTYSKTLKNDCCWAVVCVFHHSTKRSSSKYFKTNRKHKSTSRTSSADITPNLDNTREESTY